MRHKAARRLREQQANPFGEAMARGLEAGAGDYITWHGQREAYRAAYRTFFRDWNVLLAPAYGVPAFKHFPRSTNSTPARSM